MGADVTLIAASVLLLLLLSTGGRDGSLVAATSSSSPVSNSESAARSVVTSSCRRLNVEEDGETGDSCPPVSDDKPSAIYVSEERDSGQSTKTTATRGEAEREDDTRRNCQDEFKLLPVPDEVVTHGRPMTYFDRVDVAVESLMTTYGVTTYVELTKSSTIEGALNLMLPLMQPDAVVALQLQTPADGLAAIKQHEIDGLFETYRVPTDGCLTVTLNRISSDHPGPKLYAIDVSRFPTSQFVAYMQTLFGVVTASDIILLTEVVAIESSEEALRGAVCHVARPRWILHRLSSRHWFVKPEIVRGPLLPVVPPLPVCSGSSKESATAGVVDVILFTKNRPLQTFAFLDSLSRMVTGVGTVWIIGKFEDPLIHDGYRLSVQCFNRRHRGISTSAAASASTFRVEFVNDDHQLRDERGNVVRRDGGSDVWSQTLGQTLVDTLRSRIRVDHVMVAVDEMIWIRPVDLRRAVKVMSHCDSGQDSDEFFSIQLRLGENIDVYNTLPDRSQRFRFIDTDDDGGGGDDDRMYAFFPRRWQYDFGYVLNLDGVVCRRRDLLVDFAGDPDQRGWPAARGPFADCRTPGCIEDRWIRRSLRRRSRQWQVMYSRHSAVVNNVLPDDRRVANQADGKPSEASLELARRLVIEHRKLDVASFAALRADAVRSTHTKLPIGYVDLDMDCR